MGRLCRGAHEISGIKAPIFSMVGVGGGRVDGGGVVGWVVVGVVRWVVVGGGGGGRVSGGGVGMVGWGWWGVWLWPMKYQALRPQFFSVGGWGWWGGGGGVGGSWVWVGHGFGVVGWVVVWWGVVEGWWVV